MAIFNAFEFNSILFNEGDPTSLPPGEIKLISADITGKTIFVAQTGNAVNISASINSGTNISLARLSQIKSWLSIDITSGTNFVSNVKRTINPVEPIIFNGKTTFKAGSFMQANIYGSTLVEANAAVIYGINTDINSSTVMDVNAITVLGISSNFNGSTSIIANPYNEIKSNPSDITGGTNFSVNTIDVFTAIGADITSGTSVVASIDRILGISADIASGTNFNSSGSVTYSISADFTGSTIFKTVKKLGSATFNGRTIFTSSIKAPESLSLTGKRRRVSFVFEVDKPNTDSDIIDQHYKIVRFFNSLSRLSETLDYVKRTATYELQSYNIDSTSHRTWYSNADLTNIKTGQRGRVLDNATGIFLGRDGQFAIYKGPTIDSSSYI